MRFQLKSELFYTTIIALCVFSFVSLISFFINLSDINPSDFSFGFPFKFYYQYMLDCEIYQRVEYRKLLINYVFYWLLTLGYRIKKAKSQKKD